MRIEIYSVMTQEEFIEILNKNGYSYKIKEDKLVVTGNRHVYLNSLKTLPPDVKFNNRWDARFELLETLPPGVKFNNGGDVDLRSLETLPPGTEFRNGDGVHAPSLKSIPPGTEFRNGGSINLRSLTGGYFFHDWSGNIEGIDSKMLLNVMIKQGVFER